MNTWNVYRITERNGSVFLGQFNCEDLRLIDDVLYAYSAGKKVGAIAAGPGLTWNRKVLSCQ